jgi:hypothetical protein
VGQHESAIECIGRALQQKPYDAGAHNNLGLAFQQQGKLEEAVQCFRRALQLKPDYPEACNNLGNALSDLGNLDEAVACFRRALELNPEKWDTLNNLGLTLMDQGKLGEAIECCRRALRLKPDSAEMHKNLATIWLLQGNFEQGWPEYEWRWQCQDFPRRSFPQPLWNGSPLDGQTILLQAEQGFGDTLLFIRYALLVKERGGRVVVECQPPLLALLTDCPGIDELVAQGDPLPAFHVRAPLLSLPNILGTTLDSIPAGIPYLRADQALTQSWRQKLEPLGAFKIGIVWQGSPTYRGDRQRSIPVRHFDSLASVEGVRLVSLQKGPGAEQPGTRDASFPVLDLGQHLETFSDTAAVLENLDLLISCDTSVPHLAGALGVPVWLALPFAPDWRWLLEREDSPWYPHHRLFRQRRPGDWGEVFSRIAAALPGLIATQRSPRE